MKNTATSCTVVSTLIITIMFAATFTVPGGNDQNTSLSMFLKWKDIHSLCDIRFLVAVFFLNFDIDIFGVS